MLTMRDAVTNASMRAVLTLANSHDIALAPLFPDYANLVDGGFAMVGDELRFAVEVESGRRNLAQQTGSESLSYEEWDENDIFIKSSLEFADPMWRVQIMSTTLRIVNQLLPAAAEIANHPVQAITFLNSPIEVDSIDPDGQLACGGVKFHQLRPDDMFDQRLGIEKSHQPAAVFTLSRSG
jgi:hypothetical protein